MINRTLSVYREFSARRALSAQRVFSLRKAPATLAISLLRFYQKFISPLKPPTCRFYPTCSEYAIQAVRKYGFGKGLWKALRRVLKCHPFHPGGYDPV